MQFSLGQLKRPLAGVSLLLFNCVSAYSGLLAYDSFSHTNDHSYFKDGGFGWSDAWGGLAVTNGLTYAKNNHPLGTQGAGAMLLMLSERYLNTSLSGPFASLVDTNGLIGKEGTDIWISFLARPTELNQFIAGVWFGVGLDSGFALLLTNGMSELAPGVPLTLFTNYFVVEHVRFGTSNNDLREEYFNPVPGTPDPGGAQGTNVFSGNMRFNSVSLIGNSSDRSMAGIVDELRFGQAYTDVSPLPPVFLTDVHYATGQMTFSFQSLTGLLYTLETRLGVDTGSWTDVTSFSGDGNVWQLTLPTTNSETRFFRVRRE